MATPFAFQGLGVTLTTAWADIYTCPADTQTVIIGLRASNSDGTVNTTLGIRKYFASTLETKMLTGLNTDLPVGSALNAADGNRIVLSAGDKIQAIAADAAAVDLTVDYLELTF